MSSADSPVRSGDRLDITLSLFALVMGLSYYFLNELALGFFTRQRLPEFVLNFWYSSPLLGPGSSARSGL